MSNSSLKEQLEALSLGAVLTVENESSKRPVNQASLPLQKGKQKPVSKSKPAWLEQAQYGIELLRAYFPACFKENKEVQPVKIGIKQDLVKYLSTCDDIVTSDKACMVSSLAYYVNSLAYHKAMVAGVARFDLNGQPVGVVTAEEALYSAEYRKSKLQKEKT